MTRDEARAEIAQLLLQIEKEGIEHPASLDAALDAIFTVIDLMHDAEKSWAR